MIMIVLGVIIIMLLIGGLSFFAYYQIKRTDPSRADTSVQDNITTAQELLPFEDIKDGMILLGAHKYRAIIECGSTNYNLKTDAEKELIELSFQTFLNSLTFPISVYIQTQTIDNSEMMEDLKIELEETLKDYPNLEDYANQYWEDLSNIDTRTGNNKKKKKYIVVPYEESGALEKLSDEEKYKDSAAELYNRCILICEGLNGMGIKANIMNSSDIAEVIYSTYHKDNQAFVKGILSGEYQSLIVEGEENKLQSLSGDGKIDLILYEAEMKLKNQILLAESPDFIKKAADDCLTQIEKIRDEYAGYFKE